MSKPVRRHTYGPKRRPFDHTLPLYVRKAFGAHKAGEVFSVTGATRVRLMRVAGLFSARFLTHDKPVASSPADCLGGFAALARIGAACAQPKPVVDQKPKRPRAGA